VNPVKLRPVATSSLRAPAAELAELYELGSSVLRPRGSAPRGHAEGRPFVIEAIGNSLANVHVQSATLNGRPLTRAWVYRSELARGGRLRLVMGPRPNKNWASAPADLPLRSE
jgi:hypothetical protein